MILITENVGQDRKILALEDQAHGDTGNRALYGNASIHHGERATAYRRHRGRAIGLCDVTRQADGVGKLILCRQNRVQSTPGKLAMPHFATSRSPETANFTDRIGREVIVQHEMLVMKARKPVDHLLSILGAQGAGRNCLGFTAGEQGRAVCTWQEMRFTKDRTDLGRGPAIDAGAILQDRTADDFSLELLHQLLRSHLVLRRCIGEGVLCLGASFVERVRPGRLVGQLVGRGNVLADELLELVLGR